MTVQSQAWENVGERFEALGEHLRGHFDEVGADAASERAAFERSVRGLLGALEDGFDAAGHAVRDPVLREDVKNVATAVREALLASVESAGDQVRERLTLPARVTPPASTRPASTRPTTPKAKTGAKKTTTRKHAAG
jgi:hypothetical protein